jgi:hypothetical protein
MLDRRFGHSCVAYLILGLSAFSWGCRFVVRRTAEESIGVKRDKRVRRETAALTNVKCIFIIVLGSEVALGCVEVVSCVEGC